MTIRTAGLITDEERAAMEREHGIVYVAWEQYARWLARYRAANPDDDRDDAELTHVYAVACDEEAAIDPA